MKEYVYILDPGKKRDYAAEMIFRDTVEVLRGDTQLGRPDRTIHYMDLVHIDKHKGVPYPELVRKITRRCDTVQLVNNHELLVDGNSIGEAVLDMMKESGLNPIAINSHGGGAVTQIYDEGMNKFESSSNISLNRLKVVKGYGVPKLDLVDAGRTIIQQQRMRIASGITYADSFREQLSDFSPKPGKRAGYTQWAAAHDEIHDDLVICFLMGSWYIINRKDRNEIPEREIHKEVEQTWSPMDFM